MSSIEFKNNIRKLRTQKGLTLKELSEKVDGLSVSLLSKVETGERKLKSDLITQLCEVLSCSPNELLGFEGLSVISDNANPVRIDDEIYKITKQAILDIIEGNNIELTDSELLDEIYRAYNIALEIKASSGAVKATTIAARWYSERNK